MEFIKNGLAPIGLVVIFVAICIAGFALLNEYFETRNRETEWCAQSCYGHGMHIVQLERHWNGTISMCACGH